MFNQGSPCCCNLLRPQYRKAVTTVLHVLLLADTGTATLVWYYNLLLKGSLLNAKG